jgi:hypothetical protein
LPALVEIEPIRFMWSHTQIEPNPATTVIVSRIFRSTTPST